MKKITIIFVLGVLFLMGCKEETKVAEESPAENSSEWAVSTPAAEGFDSNRLDSLLAEVEDGTFGYTNQIVIVKKGKLIYNQQFARDYEEITKGIVGKMGCGFESCADDSEIHPYNYYHPKYHPYHLESDLHSIQSITKSVAATVVGVALQNGDLLSLKGKLANYFRNYTTGPLAEHLEEATIEDILTMRLGLEWKELGLSLEDTSSVTLMEKSADWVDYVLTRPVAGKPGGKWEYNSGASQLLAAIIRQETGMQIDEYAQEHLFAKLGIDNYQWKKTPTGLPDTEGGLYLAATDLAKIGQLYLQNGMWNKERILPSDWVQKATQKHVIDIYGDGGKEGYGYQWWLTATDEPAVVGLGYGDQVLLLLPKQEIVAVVNSWNVFDERERKYIFGPLLEVLLTGDRDET